MQQQKPLVEALQKFQQQKTMSFHVPGHKNGQLTTLPSIYHNVLQMDVTELTTLDDLHYPEECILEATKLLQQTYDASRSFFLVNGSTVGNLAMIYATCQQGDTVLVQRNAHKSVFHALELVGAVPVVLAPEWHEETKTAGHIALHTLVHALAQYPFAKALILTSPTYYGVTAPHLQQLIEQAHAYSIPVLVDEAHGAHFAASSHFPASALTLGADVVVQSAHKTLSAMTMASFLHVKSTLVDEERIAKYLRMLQSSSPSYVLLASLDDARHQVANYTQADYHALMQIRTQLIDALRMMELVVIEAADPLKLCIRAEGYNGFQLKAALEKQHVYAELADNEQVLFVLPLVTADAQLTYQKEIEAIRHAVTHLQKEQPIHKVFPTLDYTERVTCIERSKATKQQLVTLEQAIGQRSAQSIVPYPPGIPLMMHGETITAQHIEALLHYQQLGCQIQGEHDLTNNQLYVMKED